MAAVAGVISNGFSSSNTSPALQPARNWFRSPQTATISVSQQHLSGRGAVHFRKVVEAQLASSSTLILDLSHLQTLNSEAIGTLIKCWGAAQNSGTSLILYGVSKSLRSMLQLVRLDEMFPLAA